MYSYQDPNELWYLGVGVPIETLDSLQSGRRAHAPEKIAYAIERYAAEARRLYGVLDRQLEGREFICGEYSIADMACWPWTVTWRAQEIDLEGEFPNVRAWYNRCKERPGLRRGYEIGRDIRTISANPPDDETREILFSNKIPQER